VVQKVKWYHDETLALLRMGLRLGGDPRLAVTTTPKPLPALRRLIAEGSTVRSDAATAANAANLAPAFLGVRTSTFVGGTFVGIIPGAFVFAGVGTGLGAILASGGTPDGSALLQPHVILPMVGLAVLALIPVVTKRIRRPAAQEKVS